MKILKVRDVKTPTRGTELSAGLDFYVPDDYEVPAGPNRVDMNPFALLGPGDSVVVPSGIKADVPPGYALVAFDKSGVSTRKHLSVGACVVDEDYQGEIHLHVFNHGNNVEQVSAGEKLVQFLLLPVFYAQVEVVDELFTEETERGEGGFGSTGNGLDYEYVPEMDQTRPDEHV